MQRLKTALLRRRFHGLHGVDHRLGPENDAGLRAAADIDPAGRFVAIHDAARPLLPPALLSTMLATISDEVAGVAPALPLADTLSCINAQQTIDRIIDRTPIRALQTPQLFWRELITDLHKHYADDTNFTDDCGLALAAGHVIATVTGTHQLLKLTQPQDYAMLKTYCNAADSTSLPAVHGMPDIRIGNGFDVHKFKKGKKLKLFGITIPFDKSLDGHSDADVGFHSIVDAILGGLCLGDIGNHFPPTDNKWKNKRSIFFMTHVKKLLKNEKFKINNLDVTLICEKPKVSQYQKRFIKSVAEALDIDCSKINIKGTTTEKLGFLGREEGIACQVSVTLSKNV